MKPQRIISAQRRRE